MVPNQRCYPPMPWSRRIPSISNEMEEIHLVSFKKYFYSNEKQGGFRSHLGGPSKLMVISSPIRLRGDVREPFHPAHDNDIDAVLDHIDYIPNIATKTTKNLVISGDSESPLMTKKWPLFTNSGDMWLLFGCC